MVETANSAGSRTPEVVLVVSIVLSGVCHCPTTYTLNNYNIANIPAISYVVAVAHDIPPHFTLKPAGGICPPSPPLNIGKYKLHPWYPRLILTPLASLSFFSALT